MLSWLRSLLKRLAPPMRSEGSRLVTELRGDRAEIGQLNDTLARRASERGVPPALVHGLQVALDELLTNVVMHAKRPEGSPVRVEVDLTPQRVEALIAYHADPFDPTAQAAPDVSQGVEEREIGGLGILLVRQLMDVFEHRYENGKNHLRVAKNAG